MCSQNEPIESVSSLRHKILGAVHLTAFDWGVGAFKKNIQQAYLYQRKIYVSGRSRPWASVVSSFLLPNIRGTWVPPLDPPLHETRLTPKKHFTQKKTAYTHPQQKKNLIHAYTKSLPQSIVSFHSVATRIRRYIFFKSVCDQKRSCLVVCEFDKTCL